MSDAERITELRPVKSKAAPLIYAEQLAAELNLSLASVWRYTREQRIPTYRIGRVYRYDLAEVREALKVEVRP